MSDADITGVLTPAELSFLRDGFAHQPDALTDLARAQVVAAYPEAAGVVNALPDRFFVRPQGGALPLPAPVRDRTIIAILASTETDPGLLLAVHFYWGIAVGLSPKDIAETLLLAATYSGARMSARWRMSGRAGLHRLEIPDRPTSGRKQR